MIIATMYTDNGPACERCKGTVYQYHVVNAAVETHCRGCGLKIKFELERDPSKYPDDAFTVYHVRTEHEYYAARRQGYIANDMGQWPNACPYTYADNAALREAWLRGWNASERSREPARD